MNYVPSLRIDVPFTDASDRIFAVELRPGAGWDQCVSKVEEAYEVLHAWAGLQGPPPYPSTWHL